MRRSARCSNRFCEFYFGRALRVPPLLRPALPRALPLDVRAGADLTDVPDERGALTARRLDVALGVLDERTGVRLGVYVWRDEVLVRRGATERVGCEERVARCDVVPLNRSRAETERVLRVLVVARDDRACARVVYFVPDTAERVSYDMLWFGLVRPVLLPLDLG
jgi:hypothetical protein